MKKFILTTTAVLALSAGMASAATNPGRTAGDLNDIVNGIPSQTMNIEHGNSRGQLNNFYFTPVAINGMADVVIQQRPANGNWPANTQGFFTSAIDSEYVYITPASVAGNIGGAIQEARSALSPIQYQFGLANPEPQPQTGTNPAPSTIGIRDAVETVVDDLDDGILDLSTITAQQVINQILINHPGAFPNGLLPNIVQDRLDAVVAPLIAARTHDADEVRAILGQSGVITYNLIRDGDAWMQVHFPVSATETLSTFSQPNRIAANLAGHDRIVATAAEIEAILRDIHAAALAERHVHSRGSWVDPASIPTAAENVEFVDVVQTRNVEYVNGLNPRQHAETREETRTVQRGNTAFTSVADRTYDGVEYDTVELRNAAVNAPDELTDWSGWTEVEGSRTGGETLLSPERTPTAVVTGGTYQEERTRTVIMINGDDDGSELRQTRPVTFDATTTENVDYTTDEERTFRDIIFPSVDLRNQAERTVLAAERDADRNFADAVVHQDWTEMSRTGGEESTEITYGDPEGGVVTDNSAAKSKYLTTRTSAVTRNVITTVTVGAIIATEERIMRVVVTNGDSDHVRNDDTTESREVTVVAGTSTSSTDVEVVTTASSVTVINPAYLAAKRALEKEIHDGFESGEKLKGTFGPHDVEVTVNLDIGGVQAAKKFETTHSNLSHDLSAHATPRVGLFGIGKGNYIGYHAGVELGASVQKQGSDAKVTVGYDSGDHFHVQGSHNGFSGAGGNGQTDDALFAEASAPVDDFTTAKVRVDSEGRESVTLQDERGYSLGLSRGTDGHTSITAGYKIKF